jgi:hypothetical protein
MKNLKFWIIACAGFGLGVVVTDFDRFLELVTHPIDGGGLGIITLLGFLVPLGVGIHGILRPPVARWQAGLAFAGFATLAVKGRLWTALAKLGDYPRRGQLVMLAVVAGVVISLLAVLVPEDAD